jgi:hypothetical protein
MKEETLQLKIINGGNITIYITEIQGSLEITTRKTYA